MKLNFRQGLISFQSGAFLLPSATPGYVDLVVSPTPFIGTIAHGESDYLLKYDSTVTAAWGPMVATGDNYLFIELHMITGAISYGITTREPIISVNEPTGIVAGQMWFDLNDTVFKVRNNDNTKWIPTPRLVVGYVENGNVNTIRPYSQGSSVGLNTEGNPGYLMMDSQLRPLRTSRGEFLTQDTPVRVKTTVGTAGVLATPTNAFLPVRANEPIPSMRLVYLSGSDSISLASSNPALTTPKTPIGLVQGGLALNEIGVITQVGEVTYDQWNWPVETHGKPLYCGYSGELTLTRPQSVQAFRVGYVKSAHSILLSIDSETEAQVVASNGSIISGTPPITAVTGLNSLSEIVTTISMTEADDTHDGYLSSANFNVFNSLSGRMTVAETNITALETTKANISHTHVISDTTGLQTALDTLTSEVQSRAHKAVPAAVGNFSALTVDGDLVDSLHGPSSFATVVHEHQISEVLNLQTALNLKSDVGHVHVIADTTGLQAALNGKADFNHTHTISNISGLQTVLDNKAPLVHSHVIAEVSGLQEALDLRSLIGHTHAITDVSGLQTALNGKASTVHSHAIADTTGLQTALDEKSNVGHTHVAADVTDFGEAVDDRVASLLTAGAGINLQYLDGGNQLVVASTIPYTPPVVLNGYNNVGATIGSWSTENIQFNTQFVLAASGVGTPGTPGSMTVQLKSLKIYEGGALRSTYPNVANADVSTSLVFDSGLTATVSGTDGEIITVRSVAPTALADLDDVVVGSPSVGQVLSYNGSVWTPADAAVGGTTTSAPQNEVLLGSGSGTTSASTFTYSSTSKAFYVNVPTVQSEDAEVILRSGSNSNGHGHSSLTLGGALAPEASNVTLSAGSNGALGGDGGDLNVASGNSSFGNGGTVTIGGGNSTAPAIDGSSGAEPGGTGGSVYISSGTSVSSDGAELVVNAGHTYADGLVGGVLHLRGGDASNGAGGHVFIGTGMTTSETAHDGARSGVFIGAPYNGATTGAMFMVNNFGALAWSVVPGTMTSSDLTTTLVAGNYGTVGQVLTSNGATAAPTWADAPTGGGSSYVLTNDVQLGTAPIFGEP